MKRQLIMMFALCVSLFTAAQMRNAVSYVEETRLYTDSKDVWVLSLQMEWPHLLGGSDMKPLQQLLTRELFGVEGNSLGEAFAAWTLRLGQPASQMPDVEAQRRHYVDCHLQELWLEKDRYVSLAYSREERMGDGKVVSAVHHYLTYDIVGNRVLTTADMLKTDLLAVKPEAVALLGDKLLLEINGQGEEESVTVVGQNDIKQLLPRKLTKFLSAPTSQLPAVVLPETALLSDGDEPVCKEVEQLPTYEGGKAALAALLAANLVYPEVEMSLRQEGRVLVEFVVEKDGTPTGFRVVNPVAAGLDREAVRVLRMMHKWKPGRNGGQPVRTRMTLPVNYMLGD